MLDDYDGFIFFTGDGDMATLYERLVKRDKQLSNCGGDKMVFR